MAGRTSKKDKEKINLPDVKEPDSLKGFEAFNPQIEIVDLNILYPCVDSGSVIMREERIMGITFFSRRITAHCATCGFPLDASFPEDYPDDWKFCCSCFKWAHAIANNEEFAQKTTGLIEKIRKRITLNDGN